MMNKVSVILVSGGMDSCVTAAMAVADSDEIAFLHISYGQLTEARERKAFNDIADHFGVEKRLEGSGKVFLESGNHDQLPRLLCRCSRRKLQRSRISLLS